MKSEFGVLESDNDEFLIGFKEKPVSKYEVSMGIYMVSKKVMEYIPENSAYGFDNLMLDLIKNNKKPKIDKFKGYWLDIGRPDDYSVAIEEFEQMKDKFLRN